MDGGVTNALTGPALALLNSLQVVAAPPKPVLSTMVARRIASPARRREHRDATWVARERGGDRRGRT